MNEAEQKLVAEAIEKLFIITGADHKTVGGMTRAELLAIAKEVCAIAGVVCPIVNNL